MISRIFLILIVIGLYNQARGEKYPSGASPAKVVPQNVEVDSDEQSELKNHPSRDLEGKVGILLSQFGMSGIQRINDEDTSQAALEFYYQFAPQLQLGFAYGLSGKFWARNEFNRDYPNYANGRYGPLISAEVDGKGFEVLGRYFFSEKFAIRTGLSLSQYEDTYSLVNDTGFIASTRGTFKTDVVNLEVAASTIYNWSNGFTFGVEWFGVSIPLSYHEKKNRALGTTAIMLEAEDKLIQGFQDYHRKISFSVLNLQLGMTF